MNVSSDTCEDVMVLKFSVLPKNLLDLFGNPDWLQGFFVEQTPFGTGTDQQRMGCRMVHFYNSNGSGPTAFFNVGAYVDYITQLGGIFIGYIVVHDHPDDPFPHGFGSGSYPMFL